MQYDIVGIGNAIVDILANVSEDFLQENNMIKGSMMLIEEDEAKKLYNSLSSKEICSGGSAANTITGMSFAGFSTAFIGKVANDELGEIFTKDIRSMGVNFDTKPLVDNVSSASSMIFITPDAQRTMNTYLGASVHIFKEDIDAEIIKNSSFLYLEGYLWDSDSAREAMMDAAKISKEAGKKIVFSLSDSFCVNRFRQDFLDFIKESADIVFANEDEAKSLFNINNIDIAIEELSKICETAIVTLGENGSIAINNKEKYISVVNSVKGVVDTTGAGDLFAAGFLAGMCKNADIETCLNIGTDFASEIISHIGARPQQDLREIIQKWA